MDSKDLLLENYHYDLPADLIAQRPAQRRDESRLLVFDQDSNNQKFCHFKDILDELPENALLVANQSKVIPCRLFGQKSTGARAEFLFMTFSPGKDGLVNTLIRTGSKKNIGDKFLLGDEQTLEVEIQEILEDGTFNVRVSETNLEGFLSRYGIVPIPPYIRDGIGDEQDKKNYQTVFAKKGGSVAAPTAGLHFTPELIEKLKQKNIEMSYVTLHVGPGTFAPVKSEMITDHKMHRENFEIELKELNKIKMAYAQKRPVIAVGTTTLRVLEHNYDEILKDKYQGEPGNTDIFLHPGKTVKSIDGLITNFHLPGSTLLMLVSSLIGRERTLKIYESAVEEKMRFFSYGDAMLIKRERT